MFNIAKFLTSKYTTPAAMVGACLVVALIGVTLLHFSHASTTAISLEPDMGTILAPASKVNDSTAHGGQAVKFGSSSQPPIGTGRILWGIGDEVSAASGAPLYKDGAAKMQSMWVNKQSDMTGWAHGVDFSSHWSNGEALEVIPWMADNSSYAVTPQFQTDLIGLISALASKSTKPGPIYVVLFTEYETYSKDPGGPNSYWEKMRQTVLQVIPKLHAINSQVKVGFSFGGYNWPNNPTGTNPDVHNYEDIIAASDFTSCQQMQASLNLDSSGQNVVINKTRAAVKQLGAYGKPVMVAHYKNWGTPADQTMAFYKIADALFTEPVLSEMINEHLFAFNFMGDHYINDPGSTYNHVLPILRAHSANIVDSKPTAGLP